MGVYKRTLSMRPGSSSMRETRPRRVKAKVPGIYRQSAETPGSRSIRSFSTLAFVRQIQYDLEKAMPNVRTVLRGNRRYGFVVHVPLDQLDFPSHVMPLHYLERAIKTAFRRYDPYLQALKENGVNLHHEIARVMPSRKGHCESIAAGFILHGGKPLRAVLRFQSIPSTKTQVNIHENRNNYANR